MVSALPPDSHRVAITAPCSLKLFQQFCSDVEHSFQLSVLNYCPKRTPCSLHLTPEESKLICVCIFYTRVVYGFVFIRVGISFEINQSSFRNALTYGKRILADKSLG